MGLSFYREAELPFLEAKNCTAQPICYQKHFHDELSIGVVRKSSTSAWCDGKSMELAEGNLISFPPHMPHACQPQAHSDWSYDMLFIQSDWIHLWVDNPTPLQNLLIMNDQQASACSAWMTRSMRAFQTRQTPMEIESSVMGLISALIHFSGGRQNLPIRKGRERATFRIAQDYIHSHFREKITLDMLENLTGVSRYHLIRIFQSECNLPPAAYQILLRINYAKKELARKNSEQPKRSITEIALEAGFYDQSHFSRIFLSHVGAPPGRYASSL
ncbi:AraC-like DNA-binding protein [Paenibacillus shirakamiensis]|uniref:AraC-like DNA-binding protein n=1 Tax=Paenibacillus shirakamiensis TaxID=1265935 RepID=A0ABS4JET7_9BACL|nr:AraC family transcriptional regulator [Paenibacillus shirakamiensis]MBP2000223.1 AraC-like DNA-binding protein [Paenibacillus shirakamiensis]